MADYNRVVLMGRLTRDVELKYTPGGTAVTDAGLVVNNRRKDGDGKWVEEPCFVDVTMFGRTAEVASQYLGKGSPLFIEGHLRFESWEKDGQRRSKLKVVCDRLQLIGSKPAGGSSDGGGPQRSSHESSSTRNDSPAAAGGTSSPSSTAGSSSTARADAVAETPAGRGDVTPTGEGAGYDEADIPF